MSRLRISMENEDEVMLEGQENEPLDMGDTIAEFNEDSAALEEFSEEVTDSLQEDSKVVDVSDGLIDIASVVGNIESPSDTDVALIQSAANMAVSGTEEDAQDLIPAAESFSDKNIAIEELHKKIALAQESLGTSHLSIWKRIKTGIANFFNFFFKFKNKLKEIKAAIKLLETKRPKSVMVNNFYTKNIYFYDNNGKALTDFSKYTNELKKTSDTVNEYSKLNVSLIGVFKTLNTSVIRNIFDKKSQHSEVIKHFDTFQKGFIEKYNSVKGSKISKDGSNVTVSNNNLMGCKQFWYTYPNPEKYNGDDINEVSGSISAVRFLGVIQNDNNFENDREKVEINTKGLTYKDFYKYIEALEVLVDTMVINYNERMWNTLYNTSNDIHQNHSVNVNGGGAAIIAAGVNAAIGGYKANNVTYRLKNVEATTIWNAASTMAEFVEGLLISNLVFINFIVKEKNWSKE